MSNSECLFYYLCVVSSLTQMVESQTQRQPASVCVLQLLLVLLHDGLDDGGRHVTIT